MVATQVWLEWSAANDYYYYGYDKDHGATMNTGEKLRFINKWIVSFSIIIISISRVAIRDDEAFFSFVVIIGHKGNLRIHMRMQVLRSD